MEGAGILAVKGGMWVVVVVSVVVLSLVGGASAGNVVINESEAPISIEQASVDAASNNQSSVMVAQNSRMELPEGFAGSSVVVRNEMTGGAFGPFTLDRDSAMLIQQSTVGGSGDHGGGNDDGRVTNVVTLLLGTIVGGVLTALRTLVSDL